MANTTVSQPTAQQPSCPSEVKDALAEIRDAVFRLLSNPSIDGLDLEELKCIAGAVSAIKAALRIADNEVPQ